MFRVPSGLKMKNKGQHSLNSHVTFPEVKAGFQLVHKYQLALCSVCRNLRGAEAATEVNKTRGPLRSR